MDSRGWNVGINLRIVLLWSEGRDERIPAFVSELVARPVDVIVVFGDTAIRAAQRASRIIPIVGLADDLLGSALVDNMSRPGSNTTGVSILASELDVKRLQIVRELLPHARRVGVLEDPNTVSTRRQLETAARDLDVELVIATAKDRTEIIAAIDSMVAARVEAVNILASPVFHNFRTVILGHLRRTRLPAIHQWPETASEGGLLAYGPSIVGVYRQLAGLVDRILRGSKTADLSVEQPTRFELVINLATAKALSVVVPQSLLVRADEVVR